MSEFNLSKLSKQLERIEQTSKELDTQEKLKKYGTYLDSKQDIVQLYLLFMFFGVNCDVIQQFPEPQEYDPD